MKDLVIGCITGYNFDKIAPWVNSLDRSGFTGEKRMICYNINYDTIEELLKRNYIVNTFTNDSLNNRYFYREEFSIVVERFYHMWLSLKDSIQNYRYLITTDVKDVIFQRNPSTWIENNIINYKINASTESIFYKDEIWGSNNLLKSFGKLLYEHNKDNIINNAGVISGRADTLIDLFLNIYLLCNTTSHAVDGGGGPDQAAYNLLLNLKTYKDITHFSKSEEGWAAQLGTTGPQIASSYSEKLTDKSPILIGNTICTSSGIPFTVVHQYDRVPEWKMLIESKYA